MLFKFLISFLIIFNLTAYPSTILFDNTHAQNSGNSDWTIQGGYSDLAFLLEENNFKIEKKTTFLHEDLSHIDILVIPEPNNPLTTAEIRNILDYVRNGGKLFLIANHAGADRNGNSYDSVKIFNEFVFHFGFKVKPDHFSEIGMNPVNGRIGYKIRDIAAFAASTIEILNSRDTEILIESKAGAFCASADFGKGKVVLICDSAMFDDGTGSDGKHLHNVFNSFMYDHRQLALNIFNYLDENDPVGLKKDIPFSKLTENCITVDLFHGNNGADNTYQFMKDISEFRNVYYSSTPLNDNILKNTKTLIIFEPNIPFSDKEIRLLRKYKDIRIVFAASSSYNALNLEYTNELIAKVTGKNMYFHKNQVLDNENSVMGKPWTFIAEEKIYRTVVFSACSTGGTGDFEILLSSSKNSYTDGIPEISGSSPLIIRSRDLRLTLIGFSLFSNYNYRESVFYAENYKNVLHNTENYIKYLIKKIDGDV